jgi:tyrosyl-tRNA synthetase
MSKELLTRRVARVLPDAKGLERLMDKRRIRLYNGIDPTGSRLHLGHTIPLKKIMEFARAGHEVKLLFGTGTVLVGDPSLREHARELIDESQIDKNIAGWKQQVSRIIDFKKVKIVKNGDWITKLTIKDIIELGSKVSAVQLFKRESFTRRIKAGDTVWYHETMYPLLQGYDSVVMDVDLEVGGTDQEFNMLMGRELQKKINGREKWVLTTPMIVGTDGRQMSKTSGNCVWLDDTPEDMYGKLMRLPDEHVWDYLELVTDIPVSELGDLKKQVAGGLNPREAKARLAREVVTIYHDARSAEAAEEHFDRLFRDGQLPVDIPEKKVRHAEWQTDALLVELGLAASKSEARRLIAQGAVRINQQKFDAETITPQAGDTIQAGKRKFVKIKG